MAKAREAGSRGARWRRSRWTAAMLAALSAWARRAAITVICGIAGIGALPAQASAQQERPAPSDPERYREKAAVVLELARFIDWPSTPNGRETTFVIGVLGDESWSAAIRREAAGQRIQGREVETRSFRNLDEVDPCEVLVVGPAKARLLSTILDFLEGWRGILTVGDSTDFAELGGIVRLVERPERIAFELNRDAARRAELKLGAQLLRLAERLLPEAPPEPAP